MERIISIKFILFYFLLSSLNVNAQVQLNRAERYQPGNQFSYLQISNHTIDTGQIGNQLNWDYSNIGTISDTLFYKIKGVENTEYIRKYPKASYVELVSDGSEIIVQDDVNASRLLAFVDSNQSVKISYKQAQVFMNRPISYGDSFYSEFTNDFEYQGMKFKGKGFTSIIANGYGNLKLLNSTYLNTTKITIRHIEFDTMIQFGSVSVVETINYLWFEKDRPEPLLRIHKIISNGQVSTSVGVLHESNTLNINQIVETPDFKIYPNPSQGKITLQISHEPQPVKYAVYSMKGILVKQGSIQRNVASVDCSDIGSGIYRLRIEGVGSKLLYLD